MLWESLTPASRTTTSSWFETLTTSSSSSSCQSRTERTSHKSSTAAVPQRPASTLLRGTPDLPAEDFEVDPGTVLAVGLPGRAKLSSVQSLERIPLSSAGRAGAARERKTTKDADIQGETIRAGQEPYSVKDERTRKPFDRTCN